jgi:hypothetical protein
VFADISRVHQCGVHPAARGYGAKEPLLAFLERL